MGIFFRITNPLDGRNHVPKIPMDPDNDLCGIFLDTGIECSLQPNLVIPRSLKIQIQGDEKKSHPKKKNSAVILSIIIRSISPRDG